MGTALVGRKRARGAWAAGAIVASLLEAGPAFADGGSPLLLPLGVAIALGQSARQWQHASEPRRAGPPVGGGFRDSLLDEGIDIPDLYNVDNDRDPPRFAAPADDDRLVALELTPRRWHGWRARAAFDSVSPAPLGSSWNVFQIVIDIKF